MQELDSTLERKELTSEFTVVSEHCVGTCMVRGEFHNLDDEHGAAEILDAPSNFSCQEKPTFINRLKASPRVVDFGARLIESGKRLGFVETLSKRRLCIYGLHSKDDSTREDAKKECISLLCHGSAADIKKHVVTERKQKLMSFNFARRGKTENEQTKFIMSMQEEFVFEVPVDDEREFYVILKRVMEKLCSRYHWISGYVLETVGVR